MMHNYIFQRETFGFEGFLYAKFGYKGFHSDMGGIGQCNIRIWGGESRWKFVYGGGQIRLWGGAVVKFGCEGDKLPKPHQIRMWWFDPHQNRMTKTKGGAVYPHRK